LRSADTIHRSRRGLLHLLLPLALVLAACETDITEAGVEQASVTEFSTGIPAVEELGIEEAPAAGLRAALDREADKAGAFEFNALRIPAGTWDGYAQATEGAFLQCLVAWGPREARLAFSVGWQGRLFLQFSAPGWDAQSLQPGSTAVIRVDSAAETSVTLAASGNVLWANLGTGPALADIIAEGKELSISTGSDILVYPLEDARIAIPALYECLDRETGDEAGDGAFVIYGLELDEAARARLNDNVLGLIRDRGFGDFVAAAPQATQERYGRNALLSGTAWQGRTEVFVTVFGAREGAKKGLAELVDDAAHTCRGEVVARLIRMEPLGGPDGAGDAFGRSSLLCSDAAGEYALETLGVFSNGEVVALHAVVRDPADRERVEQSFDAMKRTLVTGI
jgi:hypothetical protein